MCWGALVTGASGAFPPSRGVDPEKLGPPFSRLHPNDEDPQRSIPGWPDRPSVRKTFGHQEPRGPNKSAGHQQHVPGYGIRDLSGDRGIPVLGFRFRKLTPQAVTPRRATPGSVGYDLFTPIDFVLRAKEQTTVFTDIAVCIPEGYYGQIASKSGLATLHEIDIRAGVIDPDYTGNIGVVMKNDSLRSF